MKSFIFYIDTPKNISFDDFKLVRRLYLPIIGANSAILYEFFYDLSSVSKNKILNLDDINKHLCFDDIIFEKSIYSLEAVGLIQTYRNDEKKMCIFNLRKPNNVEEFDQNPLLKKHLIKLIGQQNYEEIFYEQKTKYINKDSFYNVSKKYQDVFPEIFEENVNEIDEYTTLELNIETYETHDENIKNLSSSSFVKYLMKRNVTWYESQLINSLLKIGFKDSSINLLIDFSIRYNNLINCPYILTIARDFRDRKIIKYNEVKYEIAAIEEYKSRKNKKILNSKDEKNNFNFQDLSIDDIFSDEETEGMF